MGGPTLVKLTPQKECFTNPFNVTTYPSGKEPIESTCKGKAKLWLDESSVYHNQADWSEFFTLVKASYRCEGQHNTRATASS